MPDNDESYLQTLEFSAKRARQYLERGLLEIQLGHTYDADKYLAAAIKYINQVRDINGGEE